MPLHLAPISRRSFLARGAAAVAGMTVLPGGWGADGVGVANPNLFALLSDTHIPHSPEVTNRDVNMTNNLRQVVREVTALKTKPAGVLLNGDCAYLAGLPADYANLARCVAPLSEAGLPLHVTMGNHDDRGPLYDALKAQKPKQPLLDSKHVTILETPHANWFLLDSLLQVNVTAGQIGERQREWLAKALAARREKPAIVMAHHTPQFVPPAAGKPWGGLKDTVEFMALLAGQKHVKAFIFGHSHHWAHVRLGHLHLVNLPPVAYIFTAGKPNGWVLADVKKDGMNLELRTIDPAHKNNKERLELAWQ